MSDEIASSGGGLWGDAAENALDRYATLFDMVGDGIYQLDAEGRFVAVNDAIVELTGYSRRDLLGEHMSLVLADEDVSRLQDEIDRRLLDGDSKGDPIEFMARTANGDTMPCEMELHLLIEDGTFEGTLGVVRDITEHKLKLFRTLLDHSNDAVFVVDPETGRILDVNETATRQLGYDRDELTALTIPDIDTELPSREAWRSFVRELRAAESTTFQGEIRREEDRKAHV